MVGASNLPKVETSKIHGSVKRTNRSETKVKIVRKALESKSKIKMYLMFLWPWPCLSSGWALLWLFFRLFFFPCSSEFLWVTFYAFAVKTSYHFGTKFCVYQEHLPKPSETNTRFLHKKIQRIGTRKMG